MPLIEIPEDLSFVAISDAVVAAYAEDQRSVLRQHLERSRTMLRGLSEGRGIEFLLDVLREETGLDAALVSPSGRVLAAIGQPLSSEQAPRAATIARRRKLPSEVEPGLTAFGSIGRKHQTAPVLVVWATPSEIDDEARAATTQARFTGLLVVALPAGAALFAELLQPGFVSRVLSEPASAVMLVAAGGLQMLGFALIRRLGRPAE